MNEHLQKSLDTLALEDGASRFIKDNEHKQKHGLLTVAELPLFKKAFQTVEDAVVALQNSTSKGGAIQQWREDVVKITPENATYIILSTLFESATKALPITAAVHRIGAKSYVQIIGKAQEDELSYKLGVQLYSCGLSSGLFEEVPAADLGYNRLTFTTEAIAKLHDRFEWEKYMHPYYRPMVVKPRSVTEGSYIDSKLASTVTLVKTFNQQQKALLDRLIKSERHPGFIQACNAIQEVPLTINQWMLPIIEECYKRNLAIGSIPSSVLPEGTSKKIRTIRSQLKSSQAGFLTDIEEAKHYSAYDEIYLPVTMDFRGRVYSKPYLNHQRADYVKALFLFAHGKKLDTPEAVNHLKIHLANTGDFNKMSKAPYQDRINWVNDNFVRIYDTIEAPFEDLWWTEADAPFSFLAACFELVSFVSVGPDYVCRLPVAIDGSCSGLQHYSAMLRDPIGAKSVNLIPGNKPEDVYKEVANIVNELVMKDTEDPMAKEWLQHKIDRKVTKRATMTLCYGSKQYGWREQLMEDFMDKYTSQIALGSLDKHPFSNPKAASTYMSKKLDVALRMTVKAAVEGMEWLQDVAGLLARENKPVMWDTSVEFPVVNGYYDTIEKQIDIVLNGKRHRNKLIIGFKENLKPSKQRSTIAPNMVHSYDACHLMMVVLEAKEQGIDNFLLIHDSFGCLPSDMEQFSQIVRKTMVDLYENTDPFQKIYQYALSVLSNNGKKKLTPPPDRGTFDIKQILNAPYAFT